MKLDSPPDLSVPMSDWNWQVSFQVSNDSDYGIYSKSIDFGDASLLPTRYVNVMLNATHWTTGASYMTAYMNDIRFSYLKDGVLFEDVEPDLEGEWST